MEREHKYKFWLGHTKKMTYAHSLEEIKNVIPVFTDDIISLEFTGLTDKNGVDIYEGDIFIYVRENKTDMLGEVYFDQGCFRMKYGYRTPSNSDRKGYFLSCAIENDGAEEMEIVGNIYEHPHLLTPSSTNPLS